MIVTSVSPYPLLQFSSLIILVPYLLTVHHLALSYRYLFESRIQPAPISQNPEIPSPLLNGRTASEVPLSFSSLSISLFALVRSHSKGIASVRIARFIPRCPRCYQTTADGCIRYVRTSDEKEKNKQTNNVPISINLSNGRSSGAKVPVSGISDDWPEIEHRHRGNEKEKTKQGIKPRKHSEPGITSRARRVTNCTSASYDPCS